LDREVASLPEFLAVGDFLVVSNPVDVRPGEVEISVETTSRRHQTIDGTVIETANSGTIIKKNSIALCDLEQPAPGRSTKTTSRGNNLRDGHLHGEKQVASWSATATHQRPRFENKPAGRTWDRQAHDFAAALKCQRCVTAREGRRTCAEATDSSTWITSFHVQPLQHFASAALNIKYNNRSFSTHWTMGRSRPLMRRMAVAGATRCHEKSNSSICASARIPGSKYYSSRPDALPGGGFNIVPHPTNFAAAH
jgi:hypothetical protein